MAAPVHTEEFHSDTASLHAIHVALAQHVVHNEKAFGEMLAMVHEMKTKLDGHIDMENKAIVTVQKILDSIPNNDLHAHHSHHRLFAWVIGAVATLFTGLIATAAGKYLMG